jgi:cobalamin synthase
VEQEIARVRGEIESMEAEKKSMENRVAFATLQLKLSEEYKARLEVAPPSGGTRLHNAAVEGYQSAVQTALALVLTLLSAGPTVLLLLLIVFALYCLSRALWRRLRA